MSNVKANLGAQLQSELSDVRYEMQVIIDDEIIALPPIVQRKLRDLQKRIEIVEGQII